MHLSSNPRPDIQFTVHQFDRLTQHPRRSHSEVVKRIYRYLVGTQGQGLVFDLNSDMKLDCYVDAYFSGLWKHEDDQDPVCVNFSNGYGMTLVGCPLHYISKLQTEISLSTLKSRIHYSLSGYERSATFKAIAQGVWGQFEDILFIPCHHAIYSILGQQWLSWISYIT